MRHDSSLVVIERIVPENEEMPHTKYMDLRMLLVFGGMERTEAEFGHLLQRSRFDVRKIVAVGSRLSLIEAVPS